MIDIYTLNINRYLEYSEYTKLENYISSYQLERIRKFRNFEDAQRTLLGDVLARYAICKRTGAKNSELVFRMNEFGKPLLLNLTDIHYNISHSGDWVVCAVDDAPIGIDVEVIQPIELDIIAHEFFSKVEYDMLMLQDNHEKFTFFYKLWTLKESYIKAEGSGLSIPLNSFTVRIEKDSITLFIKDKKENYHFDQFFLSRNYICSICSHYNLPYNKINYNLDHFYNQVISTLLR